jgi:hypothetical protein
MMAQKKIGYNKVHYNKASRRKQAGITGIIGM